MYVLLYIIIYYADSRDWRAHLEQMKQLRANIATDLSGTKASLNRIYTDIGNTLDKVKTRETFLNKQLEPSLTEYRSLQVNLFNIHYYICAYILHIYTHILIHIHIYRILYKL